MYIHMKNKTILKLYSKKILFWAFILCISIAALEYGINNKIIVFLALVISVFTEAFVGIGALIAAIPIVGPMIVKIITIPFFWILNALGTLVSGIAIKKGYATELTKGRVLTLALLIGTIIGYIIGNLIPL